MSTPNTAQIELERIPPPCDRCRNPSLTIVQLDIRGWAPRHLSFCGHHFHTHEPVLMVTGWRLIADTRAQLATREQIRKFGGLR